MNQFRGTPNGSLFAATLGFAAGFAAVALFGPTASRFQEVMHLSPIMVGFLVSAPGADLLLTTGGASVGERDLVKSVLESMGVDFEFRRVAIRPGKPFAFGMWGTLPVCVLPGNPSAAFVCFQEFVRPIVLRMAGRTRTELPELKATLTGRAKSKAGSCYIVLARTSVMGSEFLVRPLENQCSALVRNPAMANSLIVLRRGRRLMKRETKF